MSNNSNIPNRSKLFHYWMAISICVIVIFSLLAYETNIYKLADYTKATFLSLQGSKAYDIAHWGDSNLSYLAVATLSPEHTKVQFNLANTYYQQGRYDEAREIYNKLLKEKSNALKPAIWNNLGNAWYMDGEIFQSFAAYKKSLLLNDKDAVVRQNFLFLNSKVQQFLTTSRHLTNVPPKGVDSRTQGQEPSSEGKGPHVRTQGEQPLGPYQTSDREMNQILSMSQKNIRVPKGTPGSNTNNQKPDKDGIDY